MHEQRASEGSKNMSRTTYQMQFVACQSSLWIALLMLAGCSTKDPNVASSKNDPDERIQVVTTIGMIADMVHEIGGSSVNVIQLMGPGVDPHLYKPNRDDIQSILESDIVFFAGHHLEGKMTATLEKLSEQQTVIALAEILDENLLIRDEQSQVDPHLWMDISLWSGILDPITQELGKQAPEKAADFSSNAMRMSEQLKNLHRYGQESIASIPENQRILITSHDAFRYFGRAYGVEVEGIQGLSTESEAGLQRINKLVDMISKRKIKAIFIESSVPKKNIDSLIEGCRARGHEVSIGGELYSDAMGERTSPQGTYLGMMAHNLKTVTRALGGSADESSLSESK